MDLFPQDTDVELYETAFDDEDLLKRKPISEQLSDLVQRIESPIVIALDDQWGSGKSYFLKRWVAAHTKENKRTGKTVYFDAFENDYLNDPLISLISAVAERVETDEQSKADKLRKIGGKLVRPALNIGVALATAGMVKNVNDIGDAVVEAASDQAKTAIDNMWADEKDRKEAVKEFKDLLVKFTKTTGGPIIIVVDELDRCRPDYALSVLEIIKHFFAVPRVHFILGINSDALENSVRARYGAGIDATGYLKKFINVSFSLPRFTGVRGEESIVLKYAESLGQEMRLPETIIDRLLSLLRVIGKGRDISLREISKILSHVALLPTEVLDRHDLNGHSDLALVLVVTSILDAHLHKKLKSVSAEVAEIRTLLSAPSTITKRQIANGRNPNYDREVTVWLLVVLFCCCIHDIENIEELDEPINGLKVYFGYDDIFQDRTTLAPRIQKDWIDLFRL